MRALSRKALRDAGRMRAQAVAIIAVLACGVGVFVGMRATMRALDEARAAYYARERLGHAFVTLERAPEHVARELREIPGVQQVETRVVADVTLDVEGMREPAVGRLISLPDHGRPRVNDLRLRAGRLPADERWTEAVIAEPFAEAHRFRPGDRIGAVINGKHETLHVVGVALSPEYTYTPGPGSILPDDRRFGVLWMRRKGLAAAFDLEGAFNDASLRLVPDASVDDVLERTDYVLDEYGGQGAIARKDQQSAFFVANELEQLATMATMLPALFLAVAAFLVHIVVGRIVATQREQIAALKAFGYRDGEIARHYASIVAVLVAGGSLAGLAIAGALGQWMTRMYLRFYRFPELPFALDAADAFAGVAVSVAAAAAGALAAIRATVKLPPAEAMRPAAPPLYRPTLIERARLARFVPVSARIVLREIERKPLRTALSVAGIAMAAALTVVNGFTLGAVERMLNVQFGLSRRDDVQIALFEPRAVAALSSIEALPGVLHAEPFRSVPVRLRVGRRSRTTSIEGVPRQATLQALLDDTFAPVSVPSEGIMLARKLADVLGVSPGDRVRVEVLEGRRARVDVRVARVVETFMGMAAYMELDALSHVLGDAPSMNGAWLGVDEAHRDALYAAVKETPVVAAVTARDDLLRSARRLLDENLGTWVLVSVTFAVAMALGVLYNAVRITLAERGRDLASLAVLGFRRRELAAILIGEIAVLVVIALPPGLWMGRLLASVLVGSPGFDTEQFRLPLFVSSSTYATAVLAVVAAAAVSARTAWRRLDRMDVVDVLKARD